MEMVSSRPKENQNISSGNNDSSHHHHRRRQSHSQSQKPEQSSLSMKKGFTFGSTKESQHANDKLNKSSSGREIEGAGVSSVPITTEGSPTRSSNNSNNQAMFTPQQQKVIIEHLLITKNNAPQKNYSHVPCKFFRQGSCQAGSSCPFSHSLNSTTADQTPCEYFKRGNCKFGLKCANAHILPDGVRLNPPRQQTRSRQQHYTPSNNAISSNNKNYTAVNSESCIFEEDEEDLVEEDIFQGDEGEEFYIPNDFADLLTSEELKRRNSRSSRSSSSTSLSFKRPISSDINASNSLSSSSSSLGSEPLFATNYHNHQRTYSGASLSSSASSYTTSPLLHQQLAYFQPQSQSQSSQNYAKSYNYNYNAPTKSQQTAKTYSPWSPLSNGPVTRNAMSWLGNDLTKLKIEEEEANDFVDPSSGPLPMTSQNLQGYTFNGNSQPQDTQFFFDDIPGGYYQV